jgi:hypothetical protein
MKTKTGRAVECAKVALLELLDANREQIAEIQAAQARLPDLECRRVLLLQAVQKLEAATTESPEPAVQEPGTAQVAGSNVEGSPTGRKAKVMSAANAVAPAPGLGTRRNVSIELSAAALAVLSMLTDPGYGNQLDNAAALISRVQLINRSAGNSALDEAALAPAIGELETAFDLDKTGSWMDGTALSQLLKLHGGKTKRVEEVVARLGSLRRGVGNLLPQMMVGGH